VTIYIHSVFFLGTQFSNLYIVGTEFSEKRPIKEQKRPIKDLYIVGTELSDTSICTA